MTSVFMVPNDTTALDNAAATGIQADLDAVDIDTIVAGFNGTGILTGCGVSQHGAGNLSVDIAAGTFKIAGVQYSLAGGTMTVGANGSGSPRFDFIVAQASGTPALYAGSPVPVVADVSEPCFPALPKDGTGHLTVAPLAVLYVANGTAAILGANIVPKCVFLRDPQIATALNVATWSANGPIQVKAGKLRQRIEGNWTISHIVVSRSDTPAAVCAADVLLNGSSLFVSTVATIPSGQNSVSVVPTTTALADGDYLTSSVVTASGSDISVTVYARPA